MAAPHGFCPSLAAANISTLCLAVPCLPSLTRLTNSASIAVGIGGNLATGLLLEATGSYGAVFVALMVLNASAALVFAVATSSEPLMPAAAGHEQ